MFAQLFNARFGSVRALIGLFFAMIALVASPLALAQTAAPAEVATPPVQTATATDNDDAAKGSYVDGYVLGAGDVVEVSVLGREEYRARVQVQVDGTIQLPFLNSIPAADLTVTQLREDVARRLTQGGYYTDPVVAVNVVSYASRYVVVLGEVATPGLVPIDRSYRVSEILARVGGASPAASDTLSLRREDGTDIELDIRKIATGGNEADPYVQPGDKLYVAKAETFYIYGQVNAPGTYPIAKGMTLRMALARGGGLTSMGSENRAKGFRDGKEIKRFDLNAPIKPDDVVVVGERFF